MNKEMDKKKIIMFVVITYIIAWAIEIPVSIYYVKNPGMTGNNVFRIGMVIAMLFLIYSWLKKSCRRI